MSTATTILMLHGLYSSAEEFRAIPSEDRPYAMHTKLFADLLDQLLASGVGFVGSDYVVPDAEKTVQLTFDDGHASAYLHAFDILKARSLTGIFFVTTDFIRNRSDYCNWDQLAEMAAAGMGVQSHGVTHGFLADMTAEQSRDELHRSKCEIEAGVQQPVESVSFPGGRYSTRDIGIARETGYSWCHTSRFGCARLKPGRPAVLPRVALRDDMDGAQLAALARGTGWPYYSRQYANVVKSGVKKVIGNNTYHRLYEWWANR